MPPVIEAVIAAGSSIGSGLAAAAPYAAGGNLALNAYNTLVQQPGQAQSALDTQKQALGKTNMSDFLRNQILKQQATQITGMAQNYGQPDFLKSFLQKQPNNYYQGGF